MYRSFFFVTFFSFCVFSQTHQITQDSLKSLMSNGSPYDFILIDVRNESELSSMIGNSNCKPYNLAWPTQLQAECGKIAKEQVVILYCVSGYRAQQAVNYLLSLNYTNVYSAGGISTWNGPTVTTAEKLALDSLPTPSMKKTTTTVTYIAPIRKSRAIAMKTIIPKGFSGLYVKSGAVLFNLCGRTVVTK